ncbi:MAG: GIY-YIG nuclease family protein [Candidatus Bathyarchaeota archaeon]|nr:GIY-YIG nuclease family protein [Candidatus Bathyarchaeota archaeon]
MTTERAATGDHQETMLTGIYALIVHFKEDIVVNVGALGELAFKRGFYVYVGSAQNGIPQRVKRHLKKGKRLFWHIDYLLDSDAAQIVEVLYLQGKKSVECAVAEKVGCHGDPVRGFGCSDCRCTSHLFRVENPQVLRGQMQPLTLEP